MHAQRWMFRGAAVVAVVILAACSGGSSKNAATSSGSVASSSNAASSDTRNSDQVSADSSAAEAALLTLADFPSGWEAKPRDPSTSNTPEAKAAAKQLGDCLGVDPSLFDDSTPKGSEAKSDKFTDSKNLEVETEVTVEADAARVSAGLSAMNKPEARACFSDFVKAAAAYGLAHPSSGNPPPAGLELGEPSVGTVNLTGLPTASVVYRVTLPFTISKLSIKLFIDLAFVAQGRAGLTLSFQNVGEPFPEALETQLATTAVGRMPS